MADTSIDDIHIEFLITEVKKHPVIWNNADTDYHDYVKKRESWMSIARRFTDDFAKKTNNDKNEICNKLIKKWRNIKDNHVRSLRKKKGTGKSTDSRPYVYAHLLTFLQKGDKQEYQPNITSPMKEMDCTQEDDSMHSISEHGGFDNWSPSYETETRTSSKKRKYSSDLFPSDSTINPVPSTSVVIPDFNADRSFFESILPSIYEFNEDQKLQFRTEVLNTIMRIRRSM